MATGNSTDHCDACASGEPCPSSEQNPDTTPAAACTPYEYTCGDWLVKHDANGCVTRTRVANNMANGTYTNATITVFNGCITHVASGTNVLQSRPEPCTAATPNLTPPAAFGLDPSICNQLSGGQTALLANCIVTSGQYTQVTGCGTTANPYTINYTGPLPAAGYSPTFVNGVAVQTPLITPVTKIASSTIAANQVGGTVTIDTTGVNATAGGFQIAAGLVKAWTQPITSVTGSGQITTSTTNGATTVGIDPAADILQEKVVVGVTCGNAFVDPALGSPPALGAWDTAEVRVYGSRVFTGLAYPVTAYDSAGTVLGTGSGVITLASPAQARALISALYTFAGTGSC